MTYETLTGIPLHKVAAELDKQMEPNAYKAISGGSLGGMTDIKSAYMYEEFDRVFGAVGVGWRCGYDGDLQYIAEDKSSWIQRVWIQYAFKDPDTGAVEWSSEIGMPGYNRNGGSSIDSLKGAITSGLGACGSVMGWQASVYKGLRTHDREYHGAIKPVPPVIGPLGYTDDTTKIILYFMTEQRKEGGTPMSGTEYGLLTKSLNDLVGGDKNRYHVLGVLFGMKYAKGSRPGESVGKTMLAQLKAENPKIMAAIKEIAGVDEQSTESPGS